MLSDASARRSIAIMASSAVRFCPLAVSLDPLPGDFFFSGSVVVDFLVKTPGEALISSESMSCTSTYVLRSICEGLVVHVPSFPLLDTAPAPDAVELAHMASRSIQLGHTLSRYSWIALSFCKFNVLVNNRI